MNEESKYKLKNMSKARMALAEMRHSEKSKQFDVVKTKIEYGVAITLDDYFNYYGQQSCVELCEKVGTSMAMFYQLRKRYKMPSVRLAKRFIENGNSHFTLNSIFD